MENILQDIFDVTARQFQDTCKSKSYRITLWKARFLSGAYIHIPVLSTIRVCTIQKSLVLLRCSSKLPIQFYFKGEKESLEDDAKCFEFQHICIAGQAEKKLRIFSMFIAFAKISIVPLTSNSMVWTTRFELLCKNFNAFSL